MIWFLQFRSIWFPAETIRFQAFNFWGPEFWDTRNPSAKAWEADSMRPRTCENACVGPLGKASSSKSIEKLDPAKLHGVLHYTFGPTPTLRARPFELSTEKKSCLRRLFEFVWYQTKMIKELWCRNPWLPYPAWLYGSYTGFAAVMWINSFVYCCSFQV